MAEQTELRKILVLRGPALESEGILGFLRDHFAVEVVEDLPQALEAMRKTPFAAVLAETADFLPLERGIVTQQASVVLDTLGDGVCVVAPDGQIVWANRRIRDLPSDLLEELTACCMRAYREYASQGGEDRLRGKRFSIMPEDGTYYEVVCSAVRDRQGMLRQVAAVVMDATRQRRQQMKLNAIDRAGRELVGLEFDSLSKLDAPQRLALLADRIIRCSRDVLDYQHFVVTLLDKRTNRLEIIISEGLSEEVDKYELFASTEDNGICGYVAATGRSYVCTDTAADALYLTGLHGARSSLTVPLRLQDKVVGVLNVESRTPAAFSEEDRQFAEIFANHVAVALHILNLLVFERHTARCQLSGSVVSEVTAPLNDIITELSDLQEDYIGHDDLRRRLGTIIDLATKAKSFCHQITRGPETGLITPPVVVEEDPVLSGKRILVVDDEELIRQTIHDVLTPFGCRVELAEDGRQAIDAINRSDYDLVITDIKMPNSTGYEVFAASRARNRETAVILITGFGYDPNHSIVRANREGLSRVLMKPFKVKQLLDECRKALAEPAK